MSARKKIEQKIERKREEIAEFQSKIREAEASIQAFQDVLKMLPRKDGSIEGSPLIREGSIAGKARAVLRKIGEPLHINKLMKECGIPKEKRQSLSGTLAHYVRRGEIFTRPSPGVYGLDEFVEKNNNDGLPEDFGLRHEETTGDN